MNKTANTSIKNLFKWMSITIMVFGRAQTTEILFRMKYGQRVAYFVKPTSVTVDGNLYGSCLN